MLKNNNQLTMVSSTHAGEAPNALLQPHLSTTEELLELTTIIQAWLLTTFVCHTIRNILYSSSKVATYVYVSEYETLGNPLANRPKCPLCCVLCRTKCNDNGHESTTAIYLMASYYGHASPIDPEPVCGSAANTDGALFYHARLGN